eukprot:GEMP01082619.1.p1 GENE.GEMP01082619.1~~GEMP01082619.1.p1  ORF type:complete len:201 (+),score=37.42 GEMP01082619.1:95-697(+)
MGSRGTQFLLAANTAVYGATHGLSVKTQTDTDALARLKPYISSWQSVVNEAQPARLVWSTFIHGNVMHFAMNGIALAVFGRQAELYIGTARFLASYSVFGPAALFAEIAWHHQRSEHDTMMCIGASGGVFGCVGLCTAVRPWQTLYLFGLMPVPLLVAVGASILGEMLMMDEDTAHAGHWAGFSLGMVYGLFVRKRWKGR